MMKAIGKYIIIGMITLLPVVLTLYLLYWLAVSAETVLGEMIPKEIYLPGMGMAVTVLVMFIAGVLMHTRPVGRLFLRGERIFYRLPVVKSIYVAIRDFMDYFSPIHKKDFEQVVAVKLGDSGLRLIGFVTQAEPAHMPVEMRDDESILVYLPMSYMIGGYAVLVPRALVQPLDMSMEEAMRYVLTAGVTAAPTRG